MEFPIKGNPPEAMYPTTITELARFYGVTFPTVQRHVFELLELGTDYIVSCGVYIILPKGVLKLDEHFQKEHLLDLDKHRKSFYGTNKKISKIYRKAKSLTR